MMSQDERIPTVVTRGTTWLPGMAGTRDPVVAEAVRRFYQHCLGAPLDELKVENADLRNKLVVAMECVRFYASGAADFGASARRILKRCEKQASSSDF